MIRQDIYIVDAFAKKVFEGNAAAVCALDNWLSDEKMQAIAKENKLSETAFILAEDDHYQIRWFTPNTEVALCGHATLASAFVIFKFLDYQKEKICFKSKSGDLIVEKKDGALKMDFPALPYKKITPHDILLNSINIKALEVFESTFDLLCILESEQQVIQAKPNLQVISELKYRGIILSSTTNKTSQYDIYSRCFYPSCDVNEDPVTGSAHCAITPYWTKKLGKKKIHALQGLNRKGELICEINNKRVLLSGDCQLYLKGTIFIPE